MYSKGMFNRIFFNMLTHLNSDLEELLARERKGSNKGKEGEVRSSLSEQTIESQIPSRVCREGLGFSAWVAGLV